MPPKQPPKVEEKVAIEVDEAQIFTYVISGVSPNHLLKVTANLNCRVDVFLSYINREIAKKLGEKLKIDFSSTGAEEENSELRQCFSNYKDALASSSQFDLIDDAGNRLNCQDCPSIYAKDVLKPKSLYKIAAILEDGSRQVLYS